MTNPTRKDDPIEFHMGHLLSDIRSRIEHDNTPAEQDEYIAEVRELIEAGLRQAREDTFNILRSAFKHSMQDDRWQFLQYCLTGWVECGATGFTVVAYEPGQDEPEPERKEARALVIAHGDDYLDRPAVNAILETGKACTNCGAPLLLQNDFGDRPCLKDKAHEAENVLFEVTHETIELGLQRIRHATDAPDKGPHPEQRNQTSVEYLGRGLRDSIIEADITNDAGQIDAWAYCAIAEIACFGKVMYG